MTTTTRENLKSIGISIPRNAKRFYTEDGQIVFFIKDHEAINEPYQGQWHEERVPLSEEQKAELKKTGNYGSFGWELQ